MNKQQHRINAALERTTAEAPGGGRIVRGLGYILQAKKTLPKSVVVETIIHRSNITYFFNNKAAMNRQESMTNTKHK